MSPFITPTSATSGPGNTTRLRDVYYLMIDFFGVSTIQKLQHNRHIHRYTIIYVLLLLKTGGEVLYLYGPIW